MVTMRQQCPVCGQQPFKWRSQQFVLGRYPAGNLSLSFAILMDDGSISKVLLIFKRFGLAAYSQRKCFYHQSRLYFYPMCCTGNLTKLNLSSHWRGFKTLLGVEMVALTPWDTQQNMEHTQCFAAPYWRMCTLICYKLVYTQRLLGVLF